MGNCLIAGWFWWRRVIATAPFYDYEIGLSPFDYWETLTNFGISTKTWYLDLHNFLNILKVGLTIQIGKGIK